MEFLNKFLEQFILAAVPVIVPLIVAWLVAKTRESWQSISNEKPQIAEAISLAASMAVSAAEQANLAGFIDDKKEYAVDAAEAWLAAQNIDVDLSLISAAIEAAVYDELNKSKSASAES